MWKNGQLNVFRLAVVGIAVHSGSFQFFGRRRAWDGSLVSAGATHPCTGSTGKSTLLAKVFTCQSGMCTRVLTFHMLLMLFSHILAGLSRCKNSHGSPSSQFQTCSWWTEFGAYDMVYPASTVWPMGFSWSSCIAHVPPLLAASRRVCAPMASWTWKSRLVG